MRRAESVKGLCPFSLRNAVFCLCTLMQPYKPLLLDFTLPQSSQSRDRGPGAGGQARNYLGSPSPTWHMMSPIEAPTLSPSFIKSALNKKLLPRS